MFIGVGGKIGFQFDLSSYFYHSNNSFYYDVYVGAAYRSVFLNTVQQTVYTSNDVTYTEYLQTFSSPTFLFGLQFGIAF